MRCVRRSVSETASRTSTERSRVKQKFSSRHGAPGRKENESRTCGAHLEEVAGSCGVDGGRGGEVLKEAGREKSG